MYSVEALADEPVIVVRIEPEFEFEQDLQAVHEDVARKARAIAASKVYRIMDFSALTITFSELQSVLYFETRGGPGSAADPRIRNVLVGSGEMINMAADSLGQTQYGRIATPVFATLNEALVYVRATLSHAS